MSETTTDRSRLLRGSLRGNGAFSATSGATFALAGGPIASFLGVEPGWIVNVVGLILLGFAAELFIVASLPEPPRSRVWTIIGLDLAWVAGTGVLVLADVFTPDGTTAAMLVADVVLVLAVLQTIGVRRLASAPLRA